MFYYIQPPSYFRLSSFSNLAKVQSQSFHAVAMMLMKHSYQAHPLNLFSRWASGKVSIDQEQKVGMFF